VLRPGYVDHVDRHPGGGRGGQERLLGRRDQRELVLDRVSSSGTAGAPATASRRRS
jgi:hypothetical protein